VTLEILHETSAARLLAPSDPSVLLANIANRARRGSEIYELSYGHPDGNSRSLRFSVSPMSEDGQAATLAMISDVTEVRAAEEQLRSRALHDELTGLPNRALMVDRLEHVLARHERSPRGHVAVLLADLDDFKLVNDSWGHAAGDELLRQVAHRLSTAIRAVDTVARFGGDEFVILCEHVSDEEAQAIAARVLGVLSEPFTIESHPIYVAASIGIALAPPHDAATLLQYADTAMYSAKNRGPGHLQLFDVALAENAAERLTLGNDLRVALDGDGLQLHYQPVVALATGELVGVEGLARWRHPVRGNVPPSTFVPIAERLGLAPALDRWAIKTGVTDARRLRKALDSRLHVAVNISAANVADGALEQYVNSLDVRVADDQPLLVLEITENALMQNPAGAKATLEALHDMGVEAAIDDFGTGYSSLAYLSRLPVQTLKIDRSFVSDLDVDPHARGIAAAIIDLARTLGLRTIAEGVETVAQLRVLTELGCWAAQGFLWSPAVPLDALVAMVSDLPNQRFDIACD
jgi:diguanylate cyclase (GGDEF)-like protein